MEAVAITSAAHFYAAQSYTIAVVTEVRFRKKSFEKSVLDKLHFHVDKAGKCSIIMASFMLPSVEVATVSKLV